MSISKKDWESYKKPTEEKMDAFIKLLREKEEMQMVQRWNTTDFYGRMGKAMDGDYVLYTDHLAALEPALKERDTKIDSLNGHIAMLKEEKREIAKECISRNVELVDRIAELREIALLLDAAERKAEEKIAALTAKIRQFEEKRDRGEEGEMIQRYGVCQSLTGNNILQIKLEDGDYVLYTDHLAEKEVAVKIAKNEAWDLAHEPAKCGHARANWKDPKYGTPEYRGEEKCEVCQQLAIKDTKWEARNRDAMEYIDQINKLRSILADKEVAVKEKDEDYELAEKRHHAALQQHYDVIKESEEKIAALTSENRQLRKALTNIAEIHMFTHEDGQDTKEIAQEALRGGEVKNDPVNR